MKITLDFPDMPHRDTIQMPMEFEGSVAYMVALVNRDSDGKLALVFNVARAPYEPKYSEYVQRENEGAMEILESFARELSNRFNA